MYIPHDDETIKRMLSFVGAKNLEDVVGSIPDALRFKGELDLPEGLPENTVLRKVEDTLSKNITSQQYKLFLLGGGVYWHYIPPAVDSLATLPGFVTPYTPYQPEASQGILTTTFEFQSMICQLTGMDISNASIYDGSTSAAEACLMGLRIKKGNRLFLSSGINPLYRKVIKTYLLARDFVIKELPLNEMGKTDPNFINEISDGDVIVIQSPNFYGVIEDTKNIFQKAHEKKAVTVQLFSEALSLAVLKTPGENNADIAAGEGQSLGIPMAGGGPLLGIFTCKKEFVRQMPGRIAGQTRDRKGNRGFVFTLSTREQHIRRAKATSNVCTNVQLNVIRAAIFMSLLGRNLKKLAVENLKRAHYLNNMIKNIKGVKIPFNSEFFNEFVIETQRPAEEVFRDMLEEGYACGIPLSRFDETENPNRMLVTITEQCDVQQFKNFVEALEKIAR